MTHSNRDVVYTRENFAIPPLAECFHWITDLFYLALPSSSINKKGRNPTHAIDTQYRLTASISAASLSDCKRNSTHTL